MSVRCRVHSLKITGVDDDMGSGLVLDGKDGEIGASYSLLLSSSLAYTCNMQHSFLSPGLEITK